MGEAVGKAGRELEFVREASASLAITEQMLALTGKDLNLGPLGSGRGGPLDSSSFLSPSVVAASQLPAQPEERPTRDEDLGASLLQAAPQVSWAPLLLSPQDHALRVWIEGGSILRSGGEMRASQG